MILKRHLQRYVFLLIASLSFVILMPALAQRETEEPTEELASTETSPASCDFDLTTVQSLLDQAQESFDSGDQAGAAALLEAVISETEVIRFACDPIPALTEVVSLGVGDLLTFGIPDDWVSIALDEDPFDGSVLAYIGSDSATLSGAMRFPERSLREQLVGDQKLMTISWVGPQGIDRIFGEGVKVSVDDVIQFINSDFEENDAELVGNPEALTINDWQLKRVRWSSDLSEYVAYVVDFGNDREYIVITAEAAASQFEALDMLTRAIIETMEYTPPFQP